MNVNQPDFCAICRDEESKELQIVVCKAQHKFHKLCFENAVKAQENPTCPMCRGQLLRNICKKLNLPRKPISLLEEYIELRDSSEGQRGLFCVVGTLYVFGICFILQQIVMGSNKSQ